MATRKEQILYHLYKQRGVGSIYQAPYETTQDGIGEAIGISRGHVAIEVKKLEDMGLIEHSKKHVYVEGRSYHRRNCYTLNSQGLIAVRYMLETKVVA